MRARFAPSRKLEYTLLEAPHNSTRRISLFWFEKVLLLIDLGQIYALLWALSQPWPWPAPWLKWTKWTVLVNLDFFSLSERGAGMGATGGRASAWGELDNYIYSYAVYWACIPVILVGVYYLYVRYLKHYIVDSIGKRAKLRSHLIVLAQLLYLPMGLATLRLLHCTNREGLPIVMRCDPTVKCWTTSHHIFIGFCVGSWGLLALYLPIHVYRLAVECSVYLDRLDHENYLRRKEFEYMIGLNDEWLELQMWVCSSYKRNALHHSFWVLILKLVLVLVYSLLKDHLRLQAYSYFFAVVVYVVYVWTKKPFRCNSSNRCARATCFCMLVNVTLGMWKGSGMRNVLTVASTLAMALTTGNLVCLILLCLAFLLACVPSLSSKRDGRHGSGWPMGKQQLATVTAHPHASQWVHAMLAAARFRSRLNRRPVAPELVPLDELDDLYANLWQHRALAQAKVYPGEKGIAGCLAGVPFAQALDQLVEELGDMRVEVAKTSLLPNPQLSLTIDEYAPWLAKRREQEVLTPPLKRAVLLKLLAVAAFIGDRRLAPLPHEQWMRQIGAGPEQEQGHEQEQEQEMAQERVEQKEQVEGERRGQDRAIVDAGQGKRKGKGKGSRWLRSRHGLPQGSVVPVNYAEENGMDRNDNAGDSGFGDSSATDPEPASSDSAGAGAGAGAGAHKSERAQAQAAAAAAAPAIPETHSRSGPVLLPDVHNDEMKALNEATNILLQSVSAEKAGQLSACQREWKERLKEWEIEFEERNGRAPSNADKKSIRDWYVQYQRVRRSAIAARKLLNA